MVQLRFPQVPDARRLRRMHHAKIIVARAAIFGDDRDEGNIEMFHVNLELAGIVHFFRFGNTPAILVLIQYQVAANFSFVFGCVMRGNE